MQASGPVSERVVELEYVSPPSNDNPTPYGTSPEHVHPPIGSRVIELAYVSDTL